MGITTDRPPEQQDVQDNIGSTVVYSGIANTTPANVPSSAGNVISGYGIDNLGSESILVSVDGGTTFKTISKKSFFSWNIMGEPTQLQVKTLTGTSGYELIINFEDY